jgi:uncharacterized membrane protein YeaQ/YmgE (transglycosylase-associated protein family)
VWLPEAGPERRVTASQQTTVAESSLTAEPALAPRYRAAQPSRYNRAPKERSRDNNNRGGTTLLHYVWMFIVGIVVGIIAKLIYPGAAHMGLILTGVLGIVGSFVGGFIARLFNKPAEGTPVHPAGIVMSIIGALTVLFIYNRVVT